ncbi:uncharacterized protein LOC112680412 [Sipha flava]|uniref:Uncharacterized protein LOC112680412 n=1 Tax=Sipha flava TaxID=143950 RepID=A0A8B8F7H1_9HEMI|nr:uncharacterized protein LOC112680412 [Sipha flava]
MALLPIGMLSEDAQDSRNKDIKNTEKDFLGNVQEFEPISDRICYIEFKCKWFNIVIVNCYAPTEDKSEEVKNAFYDELDRVCDGLSSGKPKIIIGDFNAKVGRERIYRPTIGINSLHSESNENGNKLISFAVARNMVISSTMFPHKNIHKQTWISPCGRIKNQIDHIVVDRRIRSSVEDIRNMKGCSAISDHFLVKARYKLKISVNWQKKQSIKKINRELLNGNQAKEYQGKLNKYLSSAEHEANIEELWGRIEKAVKRTSEEVLGYEPQRRNKHWFNEMCRKTTEERDKARLKVLQDPKEENKRELAMKQREVKKTIRMNKRAWEKERVQLIESSRKNNARVFFGKANEVKHGFKRKTSMVRGENGTLLTDNGKIADEFKKMFNTLFNQPSERAIIEERATVEQNIEPPSRAEVEAGIEMLKSGKAAGEDEIISECLKKGRQLLINQLHNLITKVWEHEEIPRPWRTSVLYPILKKGDPMNCKNYRGIFLLNTSYKMLSNILLTRIKPYLREIIGDYQGGFMTGKSTQDQIHVIKQMIKKSHEFDKDIHLLFIDFKAAYDMVNREKL